MNKFLMAGLTALNVSKSIQTIKEKAAGVGVRVMF